MPNIHTQARSEKQSVHGTGGALPSAHKEGRVPCLLVSRGVLQTSSKLPSAEGSAWARGQVL